MDVRYSTRGLREQDQFAYWREWVCGSITQLTADRDGRGPFAGEIRMRTLGALKIVTAHADPHSRTRTPADIARRGDDGFYLYLPLAGDLRVEPARGEAFAVPVGTPCLLNPSDSAALVLTEAHAQVAVSIPRRNLAPLLASPDGHFSHRSFGATRLGPLLASYIRGIAATDAVAPPLQSAVAENFCGLLALALGSSAEGQERARGSLAAVRLRAALDWIDRNYSYPGTTPATAAARLGISERYLHKLFEGTGCSFAATLARRRLRACRDALIDPAQDGRNIADIALSCGYGDIAHFNRSFRAAYGMTPREARQTRN